MIIDNLEKFCSSMRKRIFAWADVVSDNAHLHGDTFVLIELSYKNKADWAAKNITDFVSSIIKKVGRENVYSYGWVMEIKPKGRNLHYHLAMQINKSVFVPRPDAPGYWRFGSTHIYRGKSSPYYMCKYLNKLSQKIGSEFPKGSRKYSVWLNDRVYDPPSLWRVRRVAYPAYIRDFVEGKGWENARVKRQKGGGWLVSPALTGLGEDEFRWYPVYGDWECLSAHEYRMETTDWEALIGSSEKDAALSLEAKKRGAS